MDQDHTDEDLGLLESKVDASGGGSEAGGSNPNSTEEDQTDESNAPADPLLRSLTRPIPKKKITVKVGLVGDTQIGKTTLMVKYVEGTFNEDYIQTLGVNFMQKTISLKNTDIMFTIWDLGGNREYMHMLPLVCNEALALLFVFDLTRRSTLASIKSWYKQARTLNKTAPPFLVGTKFDQFDTMSEEDQREITDQARKFAKAMHAPLIFCSASESINVHKLFKIVLSKVFNLQCNVERMSNYGEPIIEY